MRRSYNLSGSVAFLYTVIKNSIIVYFYGEMKREEGDDENMHTEGAGAEAAADTEAETAGRKRRRLEEIEL